MTSSSIGSDANGLGNEITGYSLLCSCEWMMTVSAAQCCMTSVRLPFLSLAP